MTFFIEPDIEEICKEISKEKPTIEGKTIFIAGIAGFLGRYFAEVIDKLNKNFDTKINLIGADNFVSSGQLGEYVEKYEKKWFKFIKVDLTEYNNFEFLKENIDYVVHAAGIASPAQYKKRPIETYNVAINGSKSLLDLALTKKSRYTFFSSSEIYGDPDSNNIPIKESYKGYVSCLGPRACYDESKRASETLSYIYNEYKNLHTNIIRPFNVYGPGMQKTDFRVMPNFAFNIKDDLPLEIYGSGNQTRTYCYISDALKGFLKVILMGSNGEAYNIGNPDPEISVNDLAGIFKKVSNKKVKILLKDYPDTYPADEPNRRCPSIEKAKNHLNYHPNISLDDGVLRLLNWSENLQE